MVYYFLALFWLLVHLKSRPLHMLHYLGFKELLIIFNCLDAVPECQNILLKKHTQDIHEPTSALA